MPFKNETKHDFLILTGKNVLLQMTCRLDEIRFINLPPTT